MREAVKVQSTGCRLPGCGKPVPPSASRNPKIKREFCCRAHKNAFGTRARTLGRQVLSLGIPEVRAIRAITREAAAPVRRKRQETVDLERMAPQERLGALCAAAEKWGVIR